MQDYEKITNKFLPGLHKELVSKIKNDEIEVLLLNNKNHITIDSEKIKQSKWINNGSIKYNLDNFNNV